MDELFLNSNRVKVQQTEKSLQLSWRWFSYIAIFLTFFCLLWDGFLVFWIYMAVSDGIMAMALFSIIHVAVGIGLTYYTACMYVNRTTLIADKDRLVLRSGPLPWPSSNHYIDVEQLDQLYIKEKVSRGKNGTSTSYSLNALLKNGKHKIVIGSGQNLSNNDLLQIEQKVETYLGIEDRPVSGEFESHLKVAALKDKPIYARKRERDGNPTALTLADLHKGSWVDFNMQSWQVLAEVQFDWQVGDTDFQYQLINESNDMMLLYLRQHLGNSAPWLEQRVPLGEAEGFFVGDDDYFQPAVEFGESRYTLIETLNGRQYVHKDPVQLKQSIYKSTDQKQWLRLVVMPNNIKQVFKGALCNPLDFNNYLPGTK